MLRPGKQNLNAGLDRPVDASMLTVPIERVEGGPVTDLANLGPWLVVKRHESRHEVPGDRRAGPILVSRLLAERHHLIYPTPWLLGRFRFEFLLEQGLRPTDRVLDIACGVGRLAIWLVPYLDAEHYCGIDRHLRSLVAFSAYECRVNALVPKRPRLLLDADFRFDHFGGQFDLALGSSLHRHLTDERSAQLALRLRDVLRPGGRLLVVDTYEATATPYEAHGFTREAVIERRHPWSFQPNRALRPDVWTVFRRAS